MSSATYVVADDGINVVAGALARASAISSGRMQYTTQAGFRDKGQVVSDIDVSLSFSPSSWIIRHQSGNAHASHDGRTAAIIANEKPDGMIDHTLDIGPPAGIGEIDPSPPIFAGTVWWPSTVAYIQDRMDQVRLMGRTTLSGADVTIVEFDVSATDAANAFSRMAGSEVNGGILRLFVAPSIGFAIPRIEHQGADGRVTSVYESSDFEEVFPGIWFPMHSSRQNLDNRGSQGFYVDYEIRNVSDINEPIPDSEFVIEVPYGTKVYDRLDPNAPTKGFFVMRDTPEEQLDLLEGSAIPVASRSWVGRNWLLATIIGVNVGVVIVFAFWLIRRRAR